MGSLTIAEPQQWLAAVIIFGNTGHDYGGAIYNNGTLNITNITFSGNKAYYYGGGIYNAEKSLVNIESTTFTKNVAHFNNGGGIYNNGTLNITKSVFSENIAFNDGGGIYNDQNGTVTVDNTTFSKNTAYEFNGGGGGALYNNGSLNITDSTFSENEVSEEWFAKVTHGGAIYNDQYGSLSITNTTISGNKAHYGGGIYSVGSLKMSFSTLTLNSAKVTEGGAGLHMYEAVVGIKNSIVGANSGSNCGGYGYVETFKDNFDTDGTCVDFNTVDTTQLNLGPLAENGGPTKTHAFLSGSVAIDAVSDCTDLSGTKLKTDQRGVPRPQSSKCDVGAFEFTASPLSIFSLNIDTTTINVTIKSDIGGINCGSGGKQCNGSLWEGLEVTLTAVPDPNYVLETWGGDCAGCGTNATCEITMNANKTCIATFVTTSQSSLIITKAGTGSGTVTSNPAGISCGDDCQGEYSAGTQVSLQATVDGNSVFVGWTGDCSNCDTSKTCSITVDLAKSCGVVVLGGLGLGWNLVTPVGGGEKSILEILGKYQQNFTSVWKWTKDDKGNKLWGVYLPKQLDKGQEYAKAKGFVFLETISPGEGFWLNVGGLEEEPMVLAVGNTKQYLNSLKIQDNGWHLVGLTGRKDKSVSEIVSGKIDKIISIWKWMREENNTVKWGVYLPGQLDGGKEYAKQKSFELITHIKVGEGFWLNVKNLQAGEALTIE